MRRAFVSLVGLSLAASLVIACSPAAQTGGSPQSIESPQSTGSPQAVAAAQTKDVFVYKSPTCSCCHEWESYMTTNGYTVHSVPKEDMTAIKEQMGVPDAVWSCHTAVIGKYVIEGHVPIEAIQDLLASGSDIDGIALAGMPPGSPGMPGVKAARFAIAAFDDGEASSFGTY